MNTFSLLAGQFDTEFECDYLCHLGLRIKAGPRLEDEGFDFIFQDGSSGVQSNASQEIQLKLNKYL